MLDASWSVISYSLSYTGHVEYFAHMAKVAKHVWKVHNVGLGPNSHWVPTCSGEARLVGAGMGPSREKTLRRDLGISSGVSGGLLGLQGLRPVSD